MSQPALSIVVVAQATPQSGAKTALRAIESTRGQVEGAQLIVAGDLDAATREALVPYEDEFLHIPASSRSAACNGGCAAATGRYLLVVDEHEWVPNDVLLRHVEALDGDAELVASYGRTAIHDEGRVRVRPERGKGGPVFARLLRQKHLVSSLASMVWRSDALGDEPPFADYDCSAALRLDLAVKLARTGRSFTFHPTVVAERHGETVDLSGLEEMVKVLLGVLYSAESLEERVESRARFRLARHLVAIGKRHYRDDDYERAGKFFDEAVKAAPGYFKGRRYQFLNFVKTTISREKGS